MRIADETRATSLRVVVLAGLLVVASGLWFASSYVDDPPNDSTCGSVFFPAEKTAECERVMPLRTGVTGVLLVLGVGIVGAAAARPSWRGRVSIVAISSLLIAIVIAIFNEFVRSGGLWTTG
jgi:hypothetical protein